MDVEFRTWSFDRGFRCLSIFWVAVEEGGDAGLGRLAMLLVAKTSEGLRLSGGKCICVEWVVGVHM